MLRKLLSLLLFLSLSAGVAMAMAPAHRLDFKVWREGSPMGSHEIVFTQEGNRTVAEIKINLEVKLGPITLFRYRHHNREVWENGRLLSIATTTNDDGARYEVRGEATPDGFRVSGSGGTFMVPADVMTTSYWQRASMERSELLDTQKGVMIKVTTTPMGMERVKLGGGEVKAQRYESKGDLNLTLWYDEQGRWVKLRFTARGSEIVYEPKSS